MTPGAPAVRAGTPGSGPEITDTSAEFTGFLRRPRHTGPHALAAPHYPGWTRRNVASRRARLVTAAARVRAVRIHPTRRHAEH